MPKFLFSEVDHDPFAAERPGAAPAIQYAREIGGAPKLPQRLAAAGIGEAFAQDLGTLPDRALTGIVNGLTQGYSALDTFGNALLGNRIEIMTPDGPMDVTRDALVDAGVTLAEASGVTGSAMPRPSNSLGMLGGMFAKTANHEKLSTAMRLEQAGLDQDAIWRETGWGKGHDGKWRFEIPDTNMRVDRDKLEKLKDSNYGFKMSEVIEHPELYEAYPDTKKIFTTIEENPLIGGMYAPGNDILSIMKVAASPYRRLGQESAQTTEIAAHEIQHAIQSREGFAHGGSPRDPEMAIVGQDLLDKMADDIQRFKKLFAREGVVSEEDAIYYAYLVKKYNAMKGMDLGLIGYHALSGEVESRNIETRLKFQKDVARGRKDPRPPWETEDVPRRFQFSRWVPEWARKMSERGEE